MISSFHRPIRKINLKKKIIIVLYLILYIKLINYTLLALKNLYANLIMRECIDL